LLSRIEETLERAPLRVRLGFTALGIGALAYTVGLGVAPLALGAAAALASVASASGFSPGRLARRGGEGEEGAVRVFEVEVDGEAAARALSALVEERSRVGRGRYVVATIADAGASRVLVAIFASSGEDASVEAEVFKTLVAGAVKGARLKPPPPNSYRPLAELARLGPSGSRGGVPLGASGAAEQRGEGGGGSGVPLGVRADSVLPEPVWLEPGDVRGNIGVFGSTGAGKSTTLAVVASGARRAGFNVFMVDWAGEYVEKLAALGAEHVVVDPLEGGGIDPVKAFSDVEEAVSALSSSLDLTEPQEFMLQRVIEREEPSNVKELVEAVEYLEEASKWDREVKRGLLRKIGVLTQRGSAKAFTGSGEGIPREGLVVVDVSRLPSVTARRIYVNVLLAFLDKSVGGEKLAIIDEAHNVLPAGDGYLALLMSEARKRGLHFAIATQSPSLLGARVLTNTNTKIVHRTAGARDIETLRESMYLDKSLLERLPTLPTGTAILQAPSHPKPVLVRIEAGEKLRDVGGDLLKAEPIY